MIPALPGCVAEGNTWESTRDAIQRAAEIYVKNLTDRKKPVPEDTTHINEVRIDL